MGLTSVEEALRMIISQVEQLPSGLVSAEQAVGRVLASEVIARVTVPSFENSAMDGFAVCVETLKQHQQRLPAQGSALAGHAAPSTLARGSCMRVATGGLIPIGADAVVPVEQTVIAADGCIEFAQLPTVGAHIRRRGEDVEAGQTLIEAKTRLSVAHAALLWAQGVSKVAVARSPTVSIASQGDELISVQEALASGPRHAVVDTNSPMLRLAAEACGANAVELGFCSDRFEQLQAHFARGLDSDMLITIAGASVGERDFTERALKSLGVDIVFSKVAMKPGKPLLFGKKGATLVFGLPGNPVSAAVTFQLFVRPALLAMQARSAAWSASTAILERPVRLTAGLHHFLRATVTHRGEARFAHPLENQSSGALSALAAATHLISIPASRVSVQPGESVEVLTLFPDSAD